MNYQFIRTLFDIGLIRLAQRAIHEAKKIIEKSVPENFILFYIGFNSNKIPKWIDQKSIKKKYLIKKPPFNNYSGSIRFNFLNQERKLKFPIIWGHSSWPRLWQFNLHYFDWAREWLEEALDKNKWPVEANYLNFLIDHWCENNPIGIDDGWHSYTTSLRIRNWIWLFLFCPEIQTSKRLFYLWKQICYLDKHKETFHGGNHYIENLTSLIIGGLQFKSKKANRIYIQSLKCLEKELKEQILNDGGHFEGSASYHILILDRITEIGCFLDIAKKERPYWLVKAIKSMKIWAENIVFEKREIPRFNDSAKSTCPDFNKVIAFADAYLAKNNYSFKFGGLRNLLINSICYQSKLLNKGTISNISKILDLPETGWTLIRPGRGWQLTFKCGGTGPKYLSAHLHSDQLSFDLFKDGEPFFAESGTSTYELCSDRAYERSSRAHNVLQLGVINKSSNNINWIEPIEVWSNFRAGRKAKILERSNSTEGDESYQVIGSHDGYKFCRAQYKRLVQIKLLSKDELQLFVKDMVDCKNKMAWRQFWHAGPNQPEELLKTISKKLENKYSFQSEIIDTYYSTDFGEKISRRSLILTGEIKPGKHIFESEFILKT